MLSPKNVQSIAAQSPVPRNTKVNAFFKGKLSTYNQNLRRNLQSYFRDAPAATNANRHARAT